MTNLELTKEFYDQGYDNPRFFFFRSLRHINDPNAERLAAYAESKVNFQFNDKKNEEEDFLQTTLAGIELLYDMYLFEKNNELRLIQEKILPMLKQGTLYEELKACITDNSIDYITFMTILKKIEDSSESGYQILEDYATALRNFSNTSEQLLEDKSYTAIKKQRQFLVPAIHKTSQQKTHSDLADLYNDILTYSTNEHATYHKQLESTLKAQVLPMILSNTNKKILNTPNKKVAYYTQLISRLRQIIKTRENLEESENQNTIQELLNFMSNFSNEDPEFQAFKDLSDQLLNQSDVLESYGEQINNKLKDVIFLKKNNTLKGLTQDVRKKIAAYAKEQNLPEFELQVNSDNGPIKFNINNREHQRQYINYLKKYIIPKKGRYTDTQVVKNLNDFLRTFTSRKEIITLVTENNSALTLSHVMQSVATFIDGYMNNKNDATLFTIGRAIITDDGQELSEKQEKNILQSLKPILAASEKTFDSKYRAELRVLYPNEKRVNTKRFNIIAQTKAQEKLEQEEIAKIKSQLDTNNLQLKDLHQLFQIDNSAKFAETFMVPEGGFAGGSIGANVEEQIENINQMYALGGITPIDTERLLAMVLNAGEGMIGHNNRPALENYFTTVGSMLMFRSGGNALKQWRAQATNTYQNNTTKIHIYTFGTIYVPESYVLLKTYEALKDCYNILLDEAASTGSRAKIYNPVSEKDKVYDENGISSWIKTSEVNYPKVKIEMVLMGGFLDLMDKMLTRMQLMQ